MIVVQFQFDTVAAAQEFLASVGGEGATVATAPASSDKSASGRGRGRGRGKAKDAEPETKPADPLDDEPKGGDDDDFLNDDEPAAPTYTKADVRAALQALQQRTSQEQARKVLKEVGGADTLGGLAEDKYAAVIKKAESLGK